MKVYAFLSRAAGDFIGYGMLLIGLYWTYDGFQRGSNYWGLSAQTPERLSITQVTNLNGRRMFPDYAAVGIAGSNQTFATVGLFLDQFRKLEPGDSIFVYRREIGGRAEWINAAKVKESEPIYNVCGIHFSYRVFFGLLIAIVPSLMLYGEYRKRKQKRLGSTSK